MSKSKDKEVASQSKFNKKILQLETSKIHSKIARKIQLKDQVVFRPAFQKETLKLLHLFQTIELHQRNIFHQLRVLNNNLVVNKLNMIIHKL